MLLLYDVKWKGQRQTLDDFEACFVEIKPLLNQEAESTQK